MTAVKERHLLLALLLHAFGKQTASKLSQWMGVHRRTVARDAKDLEQVGIEVRTQKGAHGGFKLDQHALPRLKSLISDAASDEPLLLRALRNLIEERVPVERRPAVLTLFDQWAGEEDLAGMPADQRARLRALRCAMGSGMRVSALIRYAQQGEPERHTLEPRVIACLGNVWYIVSSSPEPRILYLHHLSQIEDVNPLDEAAERLDIQYGRRPAT
jgi:predicted DNA-binding transcriptional regulator YafY